MRNPYEYSLSNTEKDVSPTDVLLNDESIYDLGDEEILSRQELSQALIATVPIEALDNTQILQPAIGCINRCNFCSQLAGATTREMSAETLRTVIGGIRGALLNHERSMIGRERLHKPGVIFPYLDNDIGSYPHLNDLIVGVDSLGGRTRISTVSWSRHNDGLQAMHENIAANHADKIDGVRFSLTPYTYGMRTNHQEYIADFANAVKTYQPLIDEKGVSRRFACVEMRFRPDVTLTPLVHENVGDYTVIKGDDYALVTTEEINQMTQVESVDGMTPHLSTDGTLSLQLIGDVANLDKEQLDSLFHETRPGDGIKEFEAEGLLARQGSAYLFENAEGPYYCFEPLRQPNGNFEGVHFYPITAGRKTSGILDASRPLQNAIVKYKDSYGISAREDFEATTFDDVNAVYRNILAETTTLYRYAPHRAEYVRSEVLPLVRDAISILQQAELSSDYFFAYGFLIDTGVIVNQGKALSEFKGLASAADMPLTPNEEKGYGSVSQSSNRGISWRIAPVEMVSGLLNPNRPSGGYGKKSLPLIGEVQMGAEGTTSEQKRDLFLGIMALNPEAYTRVAQDGTKLPSYRIPLKGHQLGVLTPKEGAELNLMPGSKRV